MYAGIRRIENNHQKDDLGLIVSGAPASAAAVFTQNRVQAAPVKLARRGLLLSRGVAGVRGRSLVVNLPGSPGGCRDGYAVLRPALEHALSLLAGEPTAHRQT